MSGARRSVTTIDPQATLSRLTPLEHRWHGAGAGAGLHSSPAPRRSRVLRLRFLEQGAVLPVAFLLELLRRDEPQRGRVHAIAHARRSRTVVEDVAEMG